MVFVSMEYVNLMLNTFSDDGSECGNTYMTINDGHRGNHRYGRFCGESEQIYSYYAEFSNVELLFVTDSFDRDLFDYDFNVNFVHKTNLTRRFGPRPDLFPHIRGNLVERSYCERVFHDCSRLQTCYVQSPGYPGVYPRNLKCRYYLNTKQPYIKLYVDRLQPSLFDVAGQDCDSLISCPFYAINGKFAMTALITASKKEEKIL